jgi:hypothetical protein
LNGDTEISSQLAPAAICPGNRRSGRRFFGPHVLPADDGPAALAKIATDHPHLVRPMHAANHGVAQQLTGYRTLARSIVAAIAAAR